MGSRGIFTASDLRVVKKAAVLAETLTARYFGLPPDEWRQSPYYFFTSGRLGGKLYAEDVFAEVIRCRTKIDAPLEYGVVLQDPNILRALLRNRNHDLWTLALFVMTHELTHIVRFRNRSADFHLSDVRKAEEEERFVNECTREMLQGVAPVEELMGLYGHGSNTLDSSPKSPGKPGVFMPSFADVYQPRWLETPVV